MQLLESQSDTQYKLVFIVGSGRCGTTALAQMLGRLSEVAYTPEFKYFAYALSSRKRFEPYESEEDIVRFFSHALAKVVKFNPTFKGREQNTIREFRASLAGSSLPAASSIEVYRAIFHYLVQTFTSHSAAATVVLQTPTNVFFSDLIHHILGPVKYIILSRDPRNFFASAMKGSRRWHQRNVTAIAYWNLAIKYGERLKTKFPDRCLCIRQEDLLLHQDEVLGNVMDFLAIESGDGGYVEKPLQTNSSFGRSPLSSENLDRYRYTMTPREIGEVEFLTSHYLQKYSLPEKGIDRHSSFPVLSKSEKALLYGRYLMEVSKLKGQLSLRAHGLAGIYFSLKKLMTR